MSITRASLWHWPLPFAAFVLAASALLCAAPLIAADRSATEAQLQELRSKITQLQKQQESRRKNESEARHDLAEAEIKVSELAQKLAATQTELSSAQKRLKNLDAEKRSYEKKRDASLKTLAVQMRAAFTVGDQEYLKLLLNQEDPQRLGRTLTFYDYLNKARTQQIADLTESMSSLLRIAEKINLEIATLDELQKNLVEEKQRFASVQQQKKRALTRLQQEIRQQDKQIASLQTDEKELLQLLDKIETVAKRIPLPKGSSLAKLRGKLSWPSAGAMLHHYGEARHEGRLRWNGVLIGGREGTEVSAIYHGRIVFSDWLRGFGLMTIVDHGEGYMSLYGHNQTLLKQVGDWVEAGEPIATMGNTGGQSAVGLYFEIRHNGKAVDPRPWCKRG